MVDIRDFDLRKKFILKKLKEALERKEVDEPIIPLLDLINSHKDYVTTSSCAGRIILLETPEDGKKNESKFVFKSHYEVKWEDVWEALQSKFEKDVWFKMEAVILHVDCRNLEAAAKIVDIAREAGWKRSGIFLVRPHRYMVELHSTERIETVVVKNGKLLVDKDYIKILVEEANRKLRRTRLKMKRFYDLFKSYLQLET